MEYLEVINKSRAMQTAVRLATGGFVLENGTGAEK
jgi:hypothetical protein